MGFWAHGLMVPYGDYGFSGFSASTMSPLPTHGKIKEKWQSKKNIKTSKNVGKKGAHDMFNFNLWKSIF